MLSFSRCGVDTRPSVSACDSQRLHLHPTTLEDVSPHPTSHISPQPAIHLHTHPSALPRRHHPTLIPHARNSPPDSRRRPDRSAAQTRPNRPSACCSSRSPSTPACCSSRRWLCLRSSAPARARTCTCPGQCPASRSSGCLPVPRWGSMSMGQLQGARVSSARGAHAA